MEVNRIIIWTNPTAPFQKLYVMKDGILVDQMGVKFDDVEDVTYALADKYNITELHFSGTPSYGEKLAKDIEAHQVIHYGHKHFNISFV